MKKKKTAELFALLLGIGLLFSACGKDGSLLKAWLEEG